MIVTTPSHNIKTSANKAHSFRVGPLFRQPCRELRRVVSSAAAGCYSLDFLSLIFTASLVC